MRGDQPVWWAAWPTEAVMAANPNTLVSNLGLGGSFAPVGVLEADDVVELRRRDLHDRRVLDGLHPVHGAGRKVKRRPRADYLTRENPLSGRAELELDLALEHVPGLVLHLVELQAERLAGLDHEQLSRVVIGDRPDQLMAPRLVDSARLGREAVDSGEVWGAQVVVTRHGPGEPTTVTRSAQASRDSPRGAPLRPAGPSACSRSARGRGGGARAGGLRLRAPGTWSSRGRRAR